jgi:hypothetical protein
MKQARFGKTTDQRKKIALERVEILEEMEEKKPEFASRYRALAKRMREKYRLHKDF